MSLVKANHNVLPSLMNDLINPDWFGGLERNNHFVPAVNIIENENDYMLEFSLPGFDKDDFNIELDNDILTVSSEVKDAVDKETKKYSRREFYLRAFKRRFTLPETVSVEDISAAYKNGILSLSLPKKEEALPKPKRLIDIA